MNWTNRRVRFVVILGGAKISDKIKVMTGCWKRRTQF